MKLTDNEDTLKSADMDLSRLVFPAFDQAAKDRCHEHWNGIAKPLGSLGILEEFIEKIAGLTGDHQVDISQRAVIVFCADNGVVAQGITQTGSHVTAVVAKNFTQGDTSVCRMGAVANADVIPIDIGITEPLDIPGLLNRRIGPGTADISQGPAMSRMQAEQALLTGIKLVADAKEQGYRILCTGEMGIGNTTTSAAMASVLLGVPVSKTTGRGAGLTSEGLHHKIEVIERAIAINQPDPSDSLDILCKLGGYDIAGITGVFLGGALYRIPIIIDGLISAVAALTACRLYPEASYAMLASHTSYEPASEMLLSALELKPPITAGMFLGEGTGAVALLPLLDMALAVYYGMPTFSDIKIEQYKPLK